MIELLHSEYEGATVPLKRQDTVRFEVNTAACYTVETESKKRELLHSDNDGATVLQNVKTL
jgi:hypothetical protein